MTNTFPELKRFTLSRPSNHPFECTHLLAKLTDHAVTYGFLCMPALEHLNISMASGVSCTVVLNFKFVQIVKLVLVFTFTIFKSCHFQVSRKNLEALKKKLGPEAVTTIVTNTCTCGITSIPE